MGQVRVAPNGIRHLLADFCNEGNELKYRCQKLTLTVLLHGLSNRVDPGKLVKQLKDPQKPISQVS